MVLEVQDTEEAPVPPGGPNKSISKNKPFLGGVKTWKKSSLFVDLLIMGS